MATSKYLAKDISEKTLLGKIKNERFELEKVVTFIKQLYIF